MAGILGWVVLPLLLAVRSCRCLGERAVQGPTALLSLQVSEPASSPTLSINATTLTRTGDWVRVSWEGFEGADPEHDFIALYVLREDGPEPAGGFANRAQEAGSTHTPKLEQPALRAPQPEPFGVVSWLLGRATALARFLGLNCSKPADQSPDPPSSAAARLGLRQLGVNYTSQAPVKFNYLRASVREVHIEVASYRAARSAGRRAGDPRQVQAVQLGCDGLSHAQPKGTPGE